MYLIDEDRILCADTGGGLNLYNIPEPEYINTQQNLKPHEDIPRPEPTWSYLLPDSGRVHYSPLYHDNATYRFVASARNGIWGFTVPAEKGRAPSVIQLSTFSNEGAVWTPGLYKTYGFRNMDISGVRIGYSWDDRSATKTTRGELTGEQLPDINQPAFDEESGRFLYQRWDEVVILDFLDTEY